MPNRHHVYNSGFPVSWHTPEGERREGTLSWAYADEHYPLPQHAQLALEEATDALETIANVHKRVTDDGRQDWRQRRRARRAVEAEGKLRRFNRRKGDLS